MTHDELVQFAAEKAGESIIIRSVCTQTIGDEDIFESRWFYQEPDGFCDEPFDLTSPDLFFKGLDACPHFVVIRKDEPVYGYNIVIIPEYGALYKQSYTNINEIPQKFWECWAEVEGGR